MSAPLLVGDVDVQEEWTKWKSSNSKNYDSSEEEGKRFQIFEANIKDILEHNAKFQAGDESYSKALNKFADLTKEELPKGGLMGLKR